MTQSTPFMIAPGGWLGMIGGGQLGRMFCHSAQSLGYKVAVLDPAADCPAGMVCDTTPGGLRRREDGLAASPRPARTVTAEFENVPADSLRTLATRCRVSPAGDAVAIVQDRIAEKTFIASQGIPVAPHAAIRSEADLRAAPDALFPGILKVARLGYDGKGQARIATREEALAAFAEFGGVACVLEALMPLDYEISVVLARGFDGASVVFPVARNVHSLATASWRCRRPSRSSRTRPMRERRRPARQAARGHRAGLGLPRRAVRGVLRAQGRQPDRQRNRAAPAQQRPLHHGRLPLQPVRAAGARHGRPSPPRQPTGACKAVVNLPGDIWHPSAAATAQRESADSCLAALARPTGQRSHPYGQARRQRRGRKRRD